MYDNQLSDNKRLMAMLYKPPFGMKVIKKGETLKLKI